MFEIIITDRTYCDRTTDAVRTRCPQSSMERHRRVMRAGHDAAVAAGVFSGDDRSTIRYERHRGVAGSIKRSRADALRALRVREQYLGLVLLGYR